MEYLNSLVNSLPLIVSLGAIYGIMAIGVFITFRILDFPDLTVDGSFATGGAIFAILVFNGVSPVIGFIVALLGGAIAGLITALLHCYLGIPGILAGILTQLMLWSINLKIQGQANLPATSRGALISSSSNGTSIAIILGITVVVIFALYWFFGTKYGASVRSTGSNEAMSKANGININTRKIVALMISNALVALAGAIFSRYTGASDISQGRGAIVVGLAAIVIGGAICRKISKNFAIQLLFVIVGGFIYFFVYQAIAIIPGVDTKLLKMFSSIIVAIFLAVPYVITRYIKPWKAKKARALKEGN